MNTTRGLYSGEAVPAGTGSRPTQDFVLGYAESSRVRGTGAFCDRHPAETGDLLLRRISRCRGTRASQRFTRWLTSLPGPEGFWDSLPRTSSWAELNRPAVAGRERRSIRIVSLQDILQIATKPRRSLPGPESSYAFYPGLSSWAELSRPAVAGRVRSGIGSRPKPWFITHAYF